MSMAEDTTSALTPFDFHGQPISVITDAQGEPWWIASEICAALELENVAKAIGKHWLDEWSYPIRALAAWLEYETHKPSQIALVSPKGAQ